MKRLPGASLTLAALLAGGCASVPVRYYSLAARPAAAMNGTTVDCCRILMASVKLPPAVDRPEIVVRLSDDQLQVLGNDVWIAPLRDEMKVALTEEIRRGLAGGGDRSQTPNEPLTLHIDVEQFESAPAEYALIQVAWRVTIPGKPHDLTASCETSSKVPVGAGVAALVQGHQRAVTAIGAQIAAGIQNLKAGGDHGCGTS